MSLASRAASRAFPPEFRFIIEIISGVDLHVKGGRPGKERSEKEERGRDGGREGGREGGSGGRGGG